jgi:AcrR family transcriptional regulator
MASSIGQSIRPKERGRDSAATRQRLLTAASELIADLGWGRVTTRAVAARAGLPHGAVSYHFRGKQEMLIEAALRTIEQAFPMAELEALDTLADLIAVAGARLSGPNAADPVLSAVVMEAMRESERDGALREAVAALIQDYRRLLTDLVRADQERGTLRLAAPPAALATLLAAVGDGLLLHVLVDPGIDIAGAMAALRTLLTGEVPPGGQENDRAAPPASPRRGARGDSQRRPE